jgi:murein DD-endopeptidase MepM/ murein hydrolase activator NlpD
LVGSVQPATKTEPVRRTVEQKVAVALPPSKPSQQPVETARKEPLKASANKVQQASVQPLATNSRFNWPLRGSIISRFGPKAGGLHNDGINIAAKNGTLVRAAESGVVAYAGNELRGFGNLVLVRHKGGWTTAYAHAEELLVKRGDRVKKGQALARVGRSGGVDRDQLHFEIRRGSDAVDPLAYLASGTKRS